MLYPTLRPRMTDYAKISRLVVHLRAEGLSKPNMTRRITQIGAVDLDMLDEIMRSI